MIRITPIIQTTQVIPTPIQTVIKKKTPIPIRITEIPIQTVITRIRTQTAIPTPIRKIQMMIPLIQTRITEIPILM